MFSCLSKTCLIENNFDKMNTTRGGWLKERKKKKEKIEGLNRDLPLQFAEG